MFQLDEKFLADLGLGDLPEEQRKPFLQHVYNQLQKRVGEILSDGMSDEQLQEFEAIIDRHDGAVDTWVDQYRPDYLNDPLVTQLAQAVQLPVDHPNIKAEYAATKWLEVNRPDYRDVVAKTLEELKQEIVQSRDAILGRPAA